MNDLLSGETLKVQLFHQDEANSGRHVYSVYSLGLMLGLLAVALNLAVAGIAAVNAALACHFSLHEPDYKPPMEARIVFCMFLQFMASGLAGISLVMLCAEFDLAFTIVTAVLFFSGIAISAYHLISLFGSKWLSKVLKHPLHAISLVLSTVAFCFDVVSPSQSSWFTISTYGSTVTFHMMAVLHAKSPRGDRPRRFYAFIALVIACMWAGCIAVTLVLRFQRYEGRSDLQEQVSRYVIASLAGVEALVLLIIGVVYCVQVARYSKETKNGSDE
jgi:MFS family permease